MPEDSRQCPKCFGQMRFASKFGLPSYVPEENRSATNDREIVTTKAAMAVRVYVCESCRFVEMYHEPPEWYSQSVR